MVRTYWFWTPLYHNFRLKPSLGNLNTYYKVLSTLTIPEGLVSFHKTSGPPFHPVFYINKVLNLFSFQCKYLHDYPNMLMSCKMAPHLNIDTFLTP